MNLEKARETALYIRKDTSHWYQGAWWSYNGLHQGHMPASALLEHACGTTACVAGWRVALSFPGAVFEGSYGVRLQPGTETQSIDALAITELELTSRQASWLFGGHRSEEQVLWALENGNGDWEPADFDRVPLRVRRQP